MNAPKKNHREQLQALRPRITSKDLPANPSFWKKEGEDHINIAHESNLKLGQLLDLDFSRQFEHPVLGQFRSLNSLWFFLRAKAPSDKLRGMRGKEMKDFARFHCGGVSPTMPRHFKALIVHSAWVRVKQSKDIENMLLASELPFDLYHTGPVMRVRPDYGIWMARGYEEIRKALKEGREPDLSSFCDRKIKDISEVYVDALKQIMPHETPDALKDRIRAALAPAQAAPLPYDGSKAMDIDKGEKPLTLVVPEQGLTQPEEVALIEQVSAA